MKLLKTALAALSIIVITACAILIAMKLSGRARSDLTEYRLYTLSDGTKAIIGKLGQPVTLTLYYSRTSAMKAPEGIRRFNNYFMYVQDLLREYEQISAGKVKVNVVDPLPWSDAEEKAIQEGLKRFQIDQDNSFFFGLIARTELGKSKTIPFFDESRQQFLEYDLSKLISSITLREKRKIGVISSLPVLGSDMSPYMMQMMQMQGRQPEKPWTVIQQLKEEYEIEKAEVEGGKFKDAPDFLWVIHPKNLSEEQLFAIDQYVMNGGRVMVFVDPHCVLDQPEKNPQNPYAGMNHDASSNLNKLLKNWGVETEPKAISVDPSLGVNIRTSANGSPEKFPAYLMLEKDNFNKEATVTGDLSMMRTLFCGALEMVDGTGTEVTPLITTTDKAGTWTPAGAYELMQPDARRIRENMHAIGKPVMLAARITGKFKTNYPEGFDISGGDEDKADSGEADKPEEEKAEGDEADKDGNHIDAITESKDGAIVMVVADVDLVSDALAYEQSFFGMLAPFGDNISFLLNMIDTLSGSEDLIKVRSRGSFKREFTVIKDIESKVDEDSARRAEALNKKIEEFQQRLSKLAGSATDKNASLIKSKALAERRQIEVEIREAQKELRKLQEGRRIKVDALKRKYENLNRLFAPAIVLLIAIALGLFRFVRAKSMAARR